MEKKVQHSREFHVRLDLSFRTNPEAMKPYLSNEGEEDELERQLKSIDYWNLLIEPEVPRGVLVQVECLSIHKMTVMLKVILGDLFRIDQVQHMINRVLRRTEVWSKGICLGPLTWKDDACQTFDRDLIYEEIGFYRVEHPYHRKAWALSEIPELVQEDPDLNFYPDTTGIFFGKSQVNNGRYWDASCQNWRILPDWAETREVRGYALYKCPYHGLVVSMRQVDLLPAHIRTYAKFYSEPANFAEVARIEGRYSCTPGAEEIRDFRQKLDIQVWIRNIVELEWTISGIQAVGPEVIEDHCTLHEESGSSDPRTQRALTSLRYGGATGGSGTDTGTGTYTGTGEPTANPATTLSHTHHSSDSAHPTSSESAHSEHGSGHPDMDNDEDGLLSPIIHPLLHPFPHRPMEYQPMMPQSGGAAHGGGGFEVIGERVFFTGGWTGGRHE